MTIVRFALVVLMLAAARDAHACSCMESGPPCESFFQVQAVFAGTVRSITPIGVEPTWGETVRVDFEDAISFRGADAPIQSVVTSTGGASCGYGFKIGERYVVYANRLKAGGPLRTSICSRTRPIAEAADDLLFFETLSSTTSGPRVFGSITHREPGTPTSDGRNYGPVPNVRLTLRNDTATYQAATDANGRYELTGMPPATYQLTVASPPELIPYDRETQTINLSDRHSCAERNFILRFDGRVRGSVLNATGGAAAGVRVQLMRVEYVDSSDLVETIDVTADAGGRFEFSGITPGHYVLGVDILNDPVRKWLDLAEPFETDASGTFSFVVHEGLSYIVSAYFRLRTLAG